MARQSQKEAAPPRKKQRIDPSSAPRSSKQTSHSGKAPTSRTAVRKRILRHRSSQGSQADQHPAPAPTFYQRPEHPPCDTRSPNPPDTEAEDQDQCDPDEEEGTINMEHLEKLPQRQRYKQLGRLFALKGWPWPSSYWWITGTSTNATQSGDGEQPDNERRTTFASFLYVEMDVSSDEWQTEMFMSEVFFYSSLVTYSDFTLPVPFGCAVNPIGYCCSPQTKCN